MVPEHDVEGIEIRRDVRPYRFRFKDYFKGFEKCAAVREVFGEETEAVLDKVEIEFYSHKRGYMGVSDEDGCLFVSVHHLKNGEERVLYLDVVHELVHIKQFMDGKPLFDPDYEYVDRPTEVEAYRITVKEARRIGMNDKEIFDYLEVEWIDEKAHQRLASRVGVKFRG